MRWDQTQTEALNVRIQAINIADLGRMPIAALVQWMEQRTLRREEAQRTAALLRELRNRLGYLTAVGLGYLALDCAARTLSGGEAQRIHLASALGGRLSRGPYMRWTNRPWDYTPAIRAAFWAC